MMRFFKDEPMAAIGFLSIMVVCSLVIGVCSAKCLGGVNWKYSDGSRSGVVQKISKKGIIWQTWEGELNLGYSKSTSNENGGTTINPAIFYFSCSSNEAAKLVQDAERKGERVTLEYDQYVLRGWKYGGTSYDVKNVVANR